MKSKSHPNDMTSAGDYHDHVADGHMHAGSSRMKKDQFGREAGSSVKLAGRHESPGSGGPLGSKGGGDGKKSGDKSRFPADR